MAGKAGSRNRDRGSVVIRREESVEGGHHGGAWKVAYADFVTAMMAFFLLMWLLNATTEAQRKGIADYFTPNNILSRGSSGTGLPFGGKTPFDSGELVSDRGAQQVMQGRAPVVPQPAANQPPGVPANGEGGHADDAPGNGRQSGLPEDASGDTRVDARTRGPQAVGGGTAAVAAPVPAQVAGQAAHLANAGSGVKDPAGPAAAALDAAALRAAATQREKAAFDAAAAEIRAAIAADPKLAALSAQLSIDLTPEGLRIQMLDADRNSMFATGSSVPNDYAKLVLEKVAPALLKLPGAITVAGHTDAAPYKGTGKSNWELSTERANATRRLLAEAGVPEARFRSVTGTADRDLLLPADPLAAANRRIAITVLRAAPAPLPGE
jgi:chemotaxis protein MotB